MNNKKIIAVDFDGTLCAHAYPNIGGVGFSHLNVHDYLKEQKEVYNSTIILWTCRCGKALDEAVQWCKDNHIPIDYVNENTPEFIKMFGDDSRKICADEYIDDKAVHINYFEYMGFAIKK